MSETPIRDAVADAYGDDDLLFLDPPELDTAIVGVVSGCDTAPAVVYDRERLVATFIDMGMDDEEAREHLSVNIEHAHAGKSTPLTLHALASLAPDLDAGPWRCFHCDATFTDRAAAAEHFGSSERFDPACLVSPSRLRELEAELARYREEDTDLHRALHAKDCRHTTELKREEERGYARGLRDGVNLPADSPERAALEFDAARTKAWAGGTHGDHSLEERAALEFQPLTIQPCPGCTTPFKCTTTERCDTIARHQEKNHG